MTKSGTAAALALGTSVLMATGTGQAGGIDRLRDAFTFTYHIEVAGADDSDVATQKELRDSGTSMVPAQPSASSRDPLKTSGPEEIKKAEPQPVPAATTESEPAKSAAADDAPAAAAQETKAESTDAQDKAPSAPDTAPDTAPDKSAMADTSGDIFSPYLRVDGGYVLTGDPNGAGANGSHRSSETQNTGIVSIGLGTRIEEQVRIEGMFSYRAPMSIDGTDGAGNTISGEVGSMSTMLNLYYDIKQAHAWLNSKAVTPYVGAGVGLSMLDTDSMSTSGGTVERGAQTYNLTYAAMAGLATELSDFVTLDVGYRFINLGQYEQDGSFSSGTGNAATKYDDLLAHEFRAGLRFQF